MDRSGQASSACLRALLQRYVDRKRGRATNLPAIVPGYPERYWHPFERSALARALVVGGAWGVDPLLGEGIAVAFEQAEYAASRLVRAWRKGGRISPCYDLVYPFSPRGWNLWFLKKLGDFVYGRYGRFARRPLRLSAIAIRRFITRPWLGRTPR